MSGLQPVSIGNVGSLGPSYVEARPNLVDPGAADRQEAADDEFVGFPGHGCHSP